MNLTEHFTLAEFTRSQTADAHGIDNTPTLQTVSNLQHLCQQVLEPLRLWAGRPITINSGYRCPQLNTLVGGVPNSQHQRGEAADIHLSDKATGRLYAQYIRDNCLFDQLILETNGLDHWLHVSCRRTGNRHSYNP